ILQEMPATRRGSTKTIG
uniref:Uncharacterized protein n=1 Tax=Solanum lycopersicum TaxID=4081 RepID=A0A3Q7IJ20_SOLLC